MMARRFQGAACKIGVAISNGLVMCISCCLFCRLSFPPPFPFIPFHPLCFFPHVLPAYLTFLVSVSLSLSLSFLSALALALDFLVRNTSCSRFPCSQHAMSPMIFHTRPIVCVCVCVCAHGGWGCRSTAQGFEGNGAHGCEWHIARTAGIQQPDCVSRRCHV